MPIVKANFEKTQYLPQNVVLINLPGNKNLFNIVLALDHIEC